MFGLHPRPEFEPVQVKIPAAVLRQLELYIVNSRTEISGLGDVTLEPNGQALRVDAVYLLKQVSSFGDTDLDAGAQAELASDRILAGEPAGNLKLWWHSHNTMEVFWSATDERAICEKEYAGWWLSIVGNHRGQYLARLDLFPTEQLPFRLTLPGEIVEVKQYDEDQEAEIKEEIRSKVKEPKSPSKKGKRGGKQQSTRITTLDRHWPPYDDPEHSGEPVKH